MFFNNKFNTFFGLNLTLVYTFPMCIAWRFHFPIRNYDFKLAREMESTTNVTYKNFLTNPCLNTLSLLPINEETMIKIIDDLKAKNSEGVDGISVKLLKAIKYETSKIITHIK